MGRRKTIYVDEMKLLAAIAQETEEAIATCRKEAKKLERAFDQDRSLTSWSEVCFWREMAKKIKADGVEYDLLVFAGRSLTSSERIRHQEAIRRLSNRGYVQLYGAKATRVKVLPAGWKALEAKPEPATADTNL